MLPLFLPVVSPGMSYQQRDRSILQSADYVNDAYLLTDAISSHMYLHCVSNVVDTTYYIRL